MSGASKPSVDWAWGPGKSPALGAFTTGMFALGTTMVAAAADVSPWFAVATGAGMAASAAVVAAAHEQPWRVICYRAACWISAGGWSTWVLNITDPTHLFGSGPWSTAAVAALSAGVAIAGTCGTVLAHVEKKEEDVAAEKAAAAIAAAEAAAAADAEPTFATEEDRIAYEWQARLRAVTKVDGLTVEAVVRWDTGTGFTLDVDLPRDGTTISEVKRYETQLATAANLPTGCNVEVLATGNGRGSIHIRVAMINAMIDTHHLAEDYTPQTIENDYTMGVRSDAAEASINSRFACTVLIGQTDSGKSNQLNVITTGLVRAADAVVMAIDTSGRGRYPRPWVRPWKEGRAERPVMDWVAVTDEEAELMTLGLIQIIDGRTAAYEQAMHAANSDKILVSPELPQIILVVDEFGKLPAYVKDNIETISDTGRGAAVRTVVCALRATSSYISRELIIQARNRIALRVTDETELQYLFDSTWSRGRFDPAAYPYSGSAVLAVGADAPEGLKGWRMEPDRVDAAAVATSEFRPGLDPISAALAETIKKMVPNPKGAGKIAIEIPNVYSRRWERTLPIMFTDLDTTPAKPAAATQAASTNQAPESDAKDTLVHDLSHYERGMSDAMEAAQRAIDEAEAAYARNRTSDHVPGRPDDPEVQALNAAWKLPAVDPRATPPGRPAEQLGARDRMMQLLEAAGADGAGATRLAALLRAGGYPTSRQTVSQWLAEDLAAGKVTQPGGTGTVYVAVPKDPS